MSEQRAHLANGVLIGIDAMMIILGFLGWFSTSYLFNTLWTILQECGIDVNRHYIFRELGNLNIRYVLVMATGVASFVVGVIREKRAWKKQV